MIDQEAYLRVCAAFSLLEVVLVFGLFATITIISVPTKSFLGDFFIQNELAKLESAFCYVKHLAMASGQPCDLTFDLEKNAYFCQKSEGRLLFHSLKNGIKFGFIPGVCGPPARPTDKITSPLTIDAIQTAKIENRSNNGLLSIKFFPNGKIAAGSVYFIGNNGRSMGSLTCSPSKVSYLRRYVYKNGGWVVL